MKKKLSNYGEKQLHDEIVGAVAEFRADIYRKIRIADVVDISQLSRRELRDYGFKAHFDVAVCDAEDSPAFAIEYDGGGHDPKKDHLKNAIAQEADLALFRIDETLLNRTRGGMSFLQYLVHTWFMGLEFKRLQDSGTIGLDEPFMMSGFLKPKAKNIFDSEYDFRQDPLGRIAKRLINAGFSRPPLSMALMSIALLVLGRGDSSFVCFGSVPFGSRLTYGRARLDIGTPCLGELVELPFGWSALSDYCEGMVLDDLDDALEIALRGGDHVLLSRDQIVQEIIVLKDLGYKLMRAFGSSDNNFDDMLASGLG